MPSEASTRPKPVDLATRAPERDPDLNLEQRMLRVMEKVGFIPKEGTGPESQGSYKFARAETVKDTIRDALVEVGVMVWTSIEEVRYELVSGQNSTMVLATIRGTLTFVNVDRPEEARTVWISSQGRDTQDKAVSKATTSAIKYGLLNAFTVPTGHDPDEGGEDLPAAASRTSRPPRQQEPTSSEDYEPRGQSAASDSNDPEGRCPKHDRPWKPGNYGYYCPAKDDSTERGYCKLKPSKEWAAAHER